MKKSNSAGELSAFGELGKRFTKLFDSFCDGKYSTFEVFTDLNNMIFAALAAGTLESIYEASAKKYSQKQLETCAELLAVLQENAIENYDTARMDLLGTAYEDYACTGHLGQFFTPEPLSYLCAQMQIGDGSGFKTTPVTLSDPACGSGRMLIHAGQQLRANGKRCYLVAQDLDMRCVRMCAINFAFLDFEGEVICGDSLAVPTPESVTCYSINRYPDVGIREIPFEQTYSYLVWRDAKTESKPAPNPVKPLQTALF